MQIEVPKGGVAFRELRVWHRCVEHHLNAMNAWLVFVRTEHSENVFDVSL